MGGQSRCFLKKLFRFPFPFDTFQIKTFVLLWFFFLSFFSNNQTSNILTAPKK